MLRRRSLLRPGPLRPLPPVPPLAPRPLEALAHAHALLEAGRPAEAAPIFERLAEGARERGWPIRAANLALQASRAHVAAGHAPAAGEWALMGLRLLARGGQLGRVPRVLERAMLALEEAGHPQEAQRLRERVVEALAQMGLSFEQLGPPDPPVAATLPPRCSGCGAPLVPDEVEWRDARTALCPYCGSVAKATP
jgi:hypothetical protein